MSRAMCSKEVAVRWLLVLSLLLPAFPIAPSAHADTWSGGSVALDAVGVQLSRRTLYAFRDGGPTADLRLEPDEKEASTTRGRTDGAAHPEVDRRRRPAG